MSEAADKLRSDSHPVTQWAMQASLSSSDIDCVTTVMLKILDGKCKMFAEEKKAIAIIYDVTRHLPGNLLGKDIHDLIERACHSKDEGMILEIYEQRLYAETMIGRPTMKAFKAMLREQGIIGLEQGVPNQGFRSS